MHIRFPSDTNSQKNYSSRLFLVIALFPDFVVCSKKWIRPWNVQEKVNVCSNNRKGSYDVMFRLFSVAIYNVQRGDNDRRSTAVLLVQIRTVVVNLPLNVVVNLNVERVICDRIGCLFD